MRAYAWHYMAATDSDGDLEGTLEAIRKMVQVVRGLYLKGRAHMRLSKQTGFYILLFLRQICNMGHGLAAHHARYDQMLLFAEDHARYTRDAQGFARHFGLPLVSTVLRHSDCVAHLHFNLHL